MAGSLLHAGLDALSAPVALEPSNWGSVKLRPHASTHKTRPTTPPTTQIHTAALLKMFPDIFEAMDVVKSVEEGWVLLRSHV